MLIKVIFTVHLSMTKILEYYLEYRKKIGNIEGFSEYRNLTQNIGVI